MYSTHSAGLEYPRDHRYRDPFLLNWSIVDILDPFYWTGVYIYIKTRFTALEYREYIRPILLDSGLEYPHDHRYRDPFLLEYRGYIRPILVDRGILMIIDIVLDWSVVDY